jgi:multidrug efflux pump subunit AcrB
MSGFSIRNPYFIVVVSLIATVIGLTSLVRMPVDLFPEINIPEVVVATFYTGMPPEQIETDITGRFERFFTLGAGIDHMESRSLPGVSIIKVYFQPGTSADSDVNEISNLAMADLRRLPPGTLPPIVQKFDASSLPVCLITLKGEGLTETQLRDLGQFTIRNQLAGVSGASVPPPFGGKYRQIMVYVDPDRLQAYQMSPMDVVRAVNNANLILPSGDVKIGPYDYTIFTNSQFRNIPDINRIPVKTVGQSMVTVGDVGHAEDANSSEQHRSRRRPAIGASPVMKQGGDTNTIAVVDGVKTVVGRLLDVPAQLKADVVFDQSLFVKRHRDAAARRRHRVDADGNHGAGVSRQRHAAGVFVDPRRCSRRSSCVCAGGSSSTRWCSRVCAGVLAADRQRRHRAGEHLPAPGAG